MVVKVDTPDRRQLSKLAGDDPEIMQFFELLFDQAGTATPTEIEAINASIAEIEEDVAKNAADIAVNKVLIDRFTSTQAISDADSPITPTETGTLLCDASAGPILINLNPANTGIIINVKKIDASKNAVSLTPTAGTIDGSSSAPITTPFLTLTVISNGTDWFIL